MIKSFSNDDRSKPWHIGHYHSEEDVKWYCTYNLILFLHNISIKQADNAFDTLTFGDFVTRTMRR